MPHSTLISLRGCWRSTAIAAWGSLSIEADCKCLCCSVLGSALGKCQFVADCWNHLAPSRKEGYFVFLLFPYLTFKPFISKSSKWVKLLNRVRLFSTPWTVAHQAPPSMKCSRQEFWSGLPLPSPGDLPDPGIKPGSPTSQADTLLSEPPGNPPNQ